MKARRSGRLIDLQAGRLTASATVNRVMGSVSPLRASQPSNKGTGAGFLEPQSQWHKDFLREVDVLDGMLDPREPKRYRLGLARDASGRVDEMAATCPECQLLRQELSNLLRELRQAVGADGVVPDKAFRRDYQKRFAAIMKHLEKTHKLVPAGHYQAIWLAIGPGLGTAIGLALDNAGIGIAIGTGIGLAVGSSLDARARKEGRVIGGGETERGLTSPNKTKFLIIGGVALAVVALVAVLDIANIF